ncbi:hypothetical protein L0B52_04555 [Suttonella sp. R2A3]|uniref:hypothetical protein n=1 Tax=Suttonella sp. R2A3 TaxID=2908648 RepID=UPI001F30B5A6|nr:hypothetical protein [Suttonella sp. R2A3]UJF25421.1 hypothetical protein L0B52_04555 [Suttonella sp. R2A3]
MIKRMLCLLCGLYALSLFAAEPANDDLSAPFGLTVGQTTWQEAEKAFSQFEYWLGEDPSVQFYRAISIEMPGWTTYDISLDQSGYGINLAQAGYAIDFDQSGKKALLSMASTLRLWVDEQGIIQRMALYFDPIDDHQANRMYVLLSHTIKQQAELDSQGSLFATEYGTSFIIYDQATESYYAEITQAIDTYRSNQHTNFLLYKGYGGDIETLPEGITLQEYGDDQLPYTELTTLPELTWIDDFNPSWSVSLDITSDAYQQYFYGNLVRARTLDTLTPKAKAMLDEDLQRAATSKP